MAWLDKVKERAGKVGTHPMARILAGQAEKDRAKLLRLVEYVQHKRICTYALGSYEPDDACSCGLTALLESDDA